MIDFLKGRLKEQEEKLKSLYEERADASVDAVGGYDNQIKKIAREMEKLEKEISELEAKASQSSQTNITTSVPKDIVEEPSKKIIRDLIIKGKIEEAIKMMTETWEANEVLLISAQFNSLKKQNTLGTLSHENYTISNNKITNNLLSILKDL